MKAFSDSIFSLVSRSFPDLVPQSYLSRALDSLDEREEEHNPREEEAEGEAPVGQTNAVVYVVDLLQDEFATREKYLLMYEEKKRWRCYWKGSV